MYNQLTTTLIKMYNNISKFPFAIASLAMMSAAKIEWVTGAKLSEMNQDEQKFQMDKDETLTIYMQYPINGEHWQLQALLGATYSVTQNNFMCTMSNCTISWDINYSDVNNFQNQDNINTTLHFLDTNNSEVSVGLRISEPARQLSSENVLPMLGGFDFCSFKEAKRVFEAGMDLLVNIEDDLTLCNKQVTNGLDFYASFPEVGADTYTQAKFSSEMTLECFVRGQDSSSEWNTANLC